MSKKIITNKQNIILTLIYIFRFLNSKQIQEFLNHKDHRRINSWLKDLTDKGYLERDFKPVYGILTKPAVFNLTAAGRTYIRNIYQYSFPKYLKKISRDKKSSKGFRIKCQILADWYLELNQDNSIEKKGGENNNKKSKTGINILDLVANQLTVYEVPDKIPLNTVQFFTSAFYPDFVLLKSLKQDAYIRRRTTKGINHGILFVLDAYIPRFLLRYTLQRIFDNLNDEPWEDESINNIQFYFLCPNNQIIIYMRKLLPSHLQNYYGSKVVKFNFATRNLLYKKKSGKIDQIPWKTMTTEDAFDY
jgi:hypothetical protein